MEQHTLQSSSCAQRCKVVKGSAWGEGIRSAGRCVRSATDLYTMNSQANYSEESLAQYTMLLSERGIKGILFK